METMPKRITKAAFKRALVGRESLFLCGGAPALLGFDPETGEDRDVSDEEIARVRDAFAGPASIHSGLVEAMRIKLGAARR